MKNLGSETVLIGSRIYTFFELSDHIRIILDLKKYDNITKIDKDIIVKIKFYL